MIVLAARATDVELIHPLDVAVWMLVDSASLTNQRDRRAYIVSPGDEIPEGFALYVTRHDANLPAESFSHIRLPATMEYLKGGDVLRVSDDGWRLRALWRSDSHQNSILLTERCDHYCLMCSQPPKAGNDDWLLDDARELIRLLPAGTREIGFTGGEPTMYGDRFIDLLRLTRNLLPRADVHILSNGRRFVDLGFAARYAAVDNPNMMVGIPIYGAEPTLHDYVVQAAGAFDDTIRGILNLGRLQARTEIRVVLHQQTAPKLVEIADFIARNLPFVEQVALMGLEMIGLARANIPAIWIDPLEYRETLVEAVQKLDGAGLRTMVYNHPLCLTDRRIWPYAVRSISDWKNEVHPECLQCSVRQSCAGFFYSAKHKISDNIRAIPPDEAGDSRSLLALA